jgi:hypothetical protein
MKLEKLKEIIHLGGGNVEGRVVTEPGVILLSETKTTSLGGEVLDIMNTNRGDYELAELNARLNYFLTSDKDESYIKDIIFNKKHMSVLGNVHLSFLIAGVSVDTLVEFTSSKAQMSRISTSTPKFMDETLYSGTVDDVEFINKFLDLREEYKSKGGDTETINMFNLESKSTIFTVDFSLGNWFSYLTKIESYPEKEFVRVLKRIKNIIDEKYGIS